MPDRPILVMLVGLRGATASTLVAGTMAMQHGLLPLQAATTDDAVFTSSGLPSLSALRFAGWDLSPGTVFDAACQHAIIPSAILMQLRENLLRVAALPATATDLDIPREDGHTNVQPIHSTVGEAAERIASDILAATETAGACSTIVIYLGSPSRRMPDDLLAAELTAIHSTPCRAVGAGLLYAYGAIRAGAHFVDFTPCDTLESLPLRRYADAAGVQLAGRDGSTGQTMLKQHLAHLFRMRGFRLRSWYSNNLIGNHDGYVLSIPGHDATKLSDKTDMVAPLLGYDEFEHKVRIEYVADYGDRKEAWDAIELDCWAAGPISIRVNWRGQDSLLASALVLDLVRLLVVGEQRGFRGFQPQLGFFFKRPFEREGQSVAALFAELIATYSSHS